MKLRILALVALLALAAAPAFAFVSPGSFMTNERGAFSNPGYGFAGVGEDSRLIDFDPEVQPLGALPSRTSQPVPEPGTMAMASMGLVALGASLRRRLGR